MTEIQGLKGPEIESHWGMYHAKMREQLFNAVWDGLQKMYDYDEGSETFTIKDEFESFALENRDLVLKGLFEHSWAGVR